MIELSNAEKAEYLALVKKLAEGFNPPSEPTTKVPQQILERLEAELAEIVSGLRRDKAA